MKKFFYCSLFLFCVNLNVAQAQHYTGGLWSAEKTQSVQLVKLDTFLTNRLTKSLKSTPISSYLATTSVGNQGNQGSCSGWAVGYAAASILAYNKYGEDWSLATMSPSYIYNQAKLSSDCNSGAYLVDALNVAKEHGNCRLIDMPYTASSCSQMPSSEQEFSASYNTISYVRITPTSVSDICTAIANQCPIVIGIYVTSSFYSMWNSDGIWRNNVRSNDDGYHFCCIVGYDNTNRMFKVQNSWGTYGGDNGFFWVTYDLVSGGVFNEAYVLYDLNPAVDISIQGPSQFCDTAVYTLENVPSGATIQWVVTPSTVRKKAATIVRGQGTSQVTLRRGFILNGIKRDTLIRDTSIHIASLAASTSLTRPYSGNGSITAIVTFGSKSYTVRNDFSIPTQTATEKPVVNGAYNSLWYVNISHTLSVRNCDSVPNDKLLWEVHLPGQTTPLIHSGRSVTFTPKSTGTVTVIIANMESCSASNVDTLTYRVINRPSIRFVNPATAASSLDVTVSSIENEQVTAVVPYDGDYTLELWSELYGRVRMVNADVPTTQISLSGLPTDTYFIKLIIDNELVTTKQLIIK